MDNEKKKIKKMSKKNVVSLTMTIIALCLALIVLYSLTKGWFTSSSSVAYDGISLGLKDEKSSEFTLYELIETLNGKIQIDGKNFDWVQVTTIDINKYVPNQVKRFKIISNPNIITSLSFVFNTALNSQYATTYTKDNFTYFYLKCQQNQTDPFLGYRTHSISSMYAFAQSGAGVINSTLQLEKVDYTPIDKKSTELIFDLYLHKDASNDLTNWSVSGKITVK